MKDVQALFDQTAQGEREFSKLEPTEQQHLLRFAEKLRNPLIEENGLLRFKLDNVHRMSSRHEALTCSKPPQEPPSDPLGR
jgi:hypothetical protein